METAHEVGPAVGEIGECLEAEADAQGDGRGDGRALIVPNRRTVGKGTLEVVSTGFLVDEDTALMWRELMLTKAVEQFLRDVAWGDLDYLLIDMPPGTGDVQMGLARMLPHTDLIVVTTPALAAQKVAQRAVDGAAAGEFHAIARRIVDEVAPPVGNASVDMTGSSARLQESVESAFAELDARA